MDNVIGAVLLAATVADYVRHRYLCRPVIVERHLARDLRAGCIPAAYYRARMEYLAHRHVRRGVR